MKNFDWKLLIIGVLIMFAGYLWYVNGVKDGDLDRLERNEALKEQEIVHYKNELGEKIAEVESLQYTKEEMEVFQKETLNRIQQIAGKVKNIESYVKFQSSVRDTFVVSIDSTFLKDKDGNLAGDYTFTKNDGYMNWNAVVKNTPSGIDHILDYEYTPVYEIVASWKKPQGSGLFSKKRLMVDVVAENPKETITSINSVEVVQPKKPFLQTTGFWAGVFYGLGILTDALILKR